jgi:tetratricopeptide (TPR) repeat protein
MRLTARTAITLLLLCACWCCSKPKTPAEKIDYEKAKEYFTRGTEQLDQNGYDEAIENFNRAIEIDPKYVDAYINRGFARWSKGDWDGALADENKALEIDPRNASAYMFRGIAKARKGDSSGAIEDYNKAIEMDPQYADAYRNRAVDRTQLGELAEAEADYRKTLEIDPNYSYAYAGLGVLQRKKGDYRAALANYRKAVEVEPQNFEGHLALAWFLATCPDKAFRDGKNAVEHGRTAAELTHYKYSYALGTLGAAYAESGDFDKAIEYQEKALTFPEYEKEQGDKGRQRLQLYRERKPYQEP